MSRGHRLSGRVNGNLTLDAGSWEEVAGDDDLVRRVVHPPEEPMFGQLLSYLQTIEPQAARQPPDIEEEALAATAVCVRWGTYFAVLADRDKTLWSDAHRKELSRISDTEMARINIEASSALEQWIELLRRDRRRYHALVHAALSLPMPGRRATASSDGEELRMALDPRLHAAVRDRLGSERGRKARRNASMFPSRVLANSIVHVAWRNGPVEDVHAGRCSSYPLTARRVTEAEERSLIAATAGRLMHGLDVVHALADESGRDWEKKVLPFAAAPFLAPPGWSLDERTRALELPGGERAS